MNPDAKRVRSKAFISWLESRIHDRVFHGAMEMYKKRSSPKDEARKVIHKTEVAMVMIKRRNNMVALAMPLPSTLGDKTCHTSAAFYHMQSYLYASDTDVGLKAVIAPPGKEGLFVEMQESDDPDSFTFENESNIYVVMVIESGVDPYLAPKKQIDLNTTATEQDGCEEYPLISMFTEANIKNDHNIALYFTVSSEQKIFNYYLIPNGDRIMLEKVDVTGFSDEAVDEKSAKFLKFTNEYINLH